MADVCVFCVAHGEEPCPFTEPCPFCGKQVCVDHGSIIHFKPGGTEEDYLWACDDCLERMPDGGEGHWFECEGCGDNDNGCSVYHQLAAEYNRVMDPIIAAWEHGESVFGLHRQQPHG